MPKLAYGEETVEITLDTDPAWVSSTAPGANTLGNLLMFAAEMKKVRTFAAVDVPLAPLLGWSRSLLPLSSTVTTGADDLAGLRAALAAEGWDSAAVYAAPLEPLEAVAPDAIVVRAADSDALIDLVATIDREAVLIVECSAKGPRDPLVVSVLGAAFREIMGATPPVRPGSYWFICSP